MLYNTITIYTTEALMKRLVALILCAFIFCSLFACKKDGGNADSTTQGIPDFFNPIINNNAQSDSAEPSQSQGSVTSDPTEPDTPEPTPSVDPEPTEPPQPEPIDPPPSEPEQPVEPEPVVPEIPGGTANVAYPAQSKNGSSMTSLPALDNIEYSVPDPENTRGLITDKTDFSYGAAKNGQPHSITVTNQQIFDSYDTNALAWDNKTEGEKVLYLTFDCGYEYKNITPQMLDILKEKGVSAAFFCTLDYIEDAPEVVVRMIEEGHIVGNHSVHHPSNSASLSREKLASELLGVHNYLRVNFGYDSRYFRFPTGAYSQNALDLVDCVGYRSVFWSVAHADWDPENQPGVDKSFKTVSSRLHPGAVILLHTTSPDNLAILADFIDYARAEGYTFRSLDEYPYWN